MDFLSALAGSLFWAALFSLFLFVIGALAVGFFMKRAEPLKSMAAGLRLIVLFVALQVFLHLGVEEYYPRLVKHLSFLSWLVFTLAVLRLGLYIYGDLFVVRFKKGSFPAAFKNIITATVLIVVALILLKEILNINVTSLIATTTVLTATVGLALQSTLANMLAGLTIQLEKPLKQGDWISAAGHEGRVMDITLRSTRIMTIENNEVFIPNAKVLNEAVVNYTRPDATMVRTLTVGVSYRIPPNMVKEVVTGVVAGVEGVEKDPSPQIRVLRYEDFSITYEIRYAIRDFSRYINIEAEIMNLLWYHFKRSGVEIPMPIANINLRQITAESQRAEKERGEEDIINLVKNVDILSPLTDSELRKLVSRVSVKSYAAGEVPVRQGDAGNSFYIIKHGKVDVVVGKSPGESAIVATLGPGNFFGEMSLLTGAVRTASIKVKEDADFIVIDKESFRSTLANNPSIAESLSHILSERQAGLAAERERLDASAIERQRKDASNRMLAKIREFFGLKK